MPSWSAVNLPAATSDASGMEKAMRYMPKGTMKKRIWLMPETTPRLKPSMSSCAKRSESSVNMAVVMGTARIA